MKKGKRLLALFVMLAMVMSNLSGAVLALEEDTVNTVQTSPTTLEGEEDGVVASGQCGADLTWTLDEYDTLTISGTGAMDNYGWDQENNWIAPPYEAWRENIAVVVIEESVTTIGASAFYGCQNLSSVEIADRVTSVGAAAFYGCGLEEIEIPESVTTIGAKAFGYTKDGAGKEVAVEGFTIDGYDYSAAQRYAKEHEFAFHSLGKAKVAQKGKCGKQLNWSYNQKKETLTISGTGAMDDYGSDSAKAPWYPYSLNMQAVVIKDGVTSIGKGAFSGCSKMKKVTVPGSVRGIGASAFSSCASLLSITLPTGITAIGTSVFQGCHQLKSVFIPGTVTSIGREAFSDCWDLKEISIPSSVKRIGYRAFYACASLDNIMVPASVTKIEDGAFGLFYDAEKKTDFIDKNFAISGNRGTAAEKYAKQCGIRFVAVFGPPEISTLTNTSKGVKVAWKKVSDAKGYYIYRSTGTGSYKKVKTTASLSWTDTGAKSNGTKYNYKVYAYKGKTQSGASKVQSIYYLSAPKISSIKNSAAQKATVKWGKNAKASGYEVQYSTASNFKGAKTVQVSSGKKTSATLSKLTKKKKYYVRVRAYKTVSGTKYVSAWSSSKNVTIKK